MTTLKSTSRGQGRKGDRPSERSLSANLRANGQKLYQAEPQHESAKHDEARRDHCGVVYAVVAQIKVVFLPGDLPPQSQLPTVHRDWILDVWMLSGPVEEWGDQLRAYHERAPVFAVLGGMLPESSAPLAQFCEVNGIPCLLPSTKNPEAQEDNLYTLYFSRGLGLETDLNATHLQGYQFDTLIQVYCEASAARSAEQLGAFYAGLKIVSRQLAFDCENETPADQLQSLLDESHNNVVLVLWLDRAHLAEIDSSLQARVYCLQPRNRS